MPLEVFMVKIIWVKDEYPKNLEIRQVYGIVFDSVGRILLRIENKPDNKNFIVLEAELQSLSTKMLKQH